MKRIITVALLLEAITGRAQSRNEQLHREGNYIYITNPLGYWFNKIGGGYEHYKDRNGYVGSINKYLGFYPGIQVNGEYRYYCHISPRKETYVYAKATMGSVHYYNWGHTLPGNPIDKVSSNNTSTGGGWDLNFATPDYRSATYFYGGIGGGIGKRYNFRRLSIGINAGLKYTPVFNLAAGDKKDFSAFRVIGPGSIPDLNFTIGYKF